MQIGKFELVNEEKVERALNGTVGQSGIVHGGIRKEDGSFDEADLLAEYDKLGGLIQSGTDKVKTGSFYDFKNRRALAKPNVVFTFFVNGKFVEVKDGVELPGEVKAAKIVAEENEEEAKLGEKVEKKITRRKK